MSNIDIIRQEIERPEVDLEEEADRMFFSLGWYEGDHHQPMLDCVSLEQFRGIARHFVEWSAKNAKYEKPSKDLEEAAKEYADGIIHLEDALMCKAAFIAGAEWQGGRLTVEDIKTILDISFWNDDPEKILEEYNRLKK